MVTLKRGRAESVSRFHPWIFSGAVARASDGLKNGDPVEVYAHEGTFVAFGFFFTGSIAVKVLSFEPVESLLSLVRRRLHTALERRSLLRLPSQGVTNAFRLVNAEGDGLPGLVVDIFDRHAVLLCYNEGFARIREDLCKLLLEVCPQLETVYDKSGSVLKDPSRSGHLKGAATAGDILENGLSFRVDWVEGQKTGFFLDQRSSRQCLRHYAAGKRVLNTFSYSGGFSVYAAAGGASQVHSVDSSRKAIAWTDHHMQLNAPQTPHESFAVDVFEFLAASTESYDLIILDPPSFAKSLESRHSAITAYRRLHRLALSRLAPSGVLFTFSCTQVVSFEHFSGAIAAAALDLPVPLVQLERLGYGGDHPVSLHHPEGNYLKGLVLQK